MGKRALTLVTLAGVAAISFAHEADAQSVILPQTVFYQSDTALGCGGGTITSNGLGTLGCSAYNTGATSSIVPVTPISDKFTASVYRFGQIAGPSVTEAYAVVLWAFYLRGVGSVPVNVFAAGSTSVNAAGADYWTDAFFELSTDPVGYQPLVLASSHTGNSPGAAPGNGLPFSLNPQTIWLKTNTIYYVQSGVDAQISNTTFGGGSASAFLDPSIQIDPAFLATHPGYLIVFSPGYRRESDDDGSDE